MPWFDSEIRRVLPDLIVCLGATASKALLGRDFKVTQDHGLRFDWDGIPTMATIHPVAVLRAGPDRSQRLSQMVADLTAAREMIEG